MSAPGFRQVIFSMLFAINTSDSLTTEKLYEEVYVIGDYVRLH